MSRLQPVPWVEEAPIPTRSAQPILERIRHGWGIDLYRIRWIRAALASPWPQLAVRLIVLAGFVFTLVAAQLGPRVGSRNFAIIMVWIAWWTVLKLGFIPLGGRSWCSICPIALPGEWLQRGGLLPRHKHRFGLNLRWPDALRGSWLQSGGFLLIGIFSAVTLTDPHLTGWVLLGIFVLSTGMSLIFEQRAFCSHVCPVGGFSAMFAKAAPLEIRTVEREVCTQHVEKLCYQACPWGIYPLAMKDSSACGLCMECLRACPKDNLALVVRPYGADLGKRSTSPSLDEAFLSLVMLGSALTFSAVFLGPWGWLKLSAYRIGSAQWLIYTAGFLALNLVVLPGLFGLGVWLKKFISCSQAKLKQVIATSARGLIPLGLLAWIAFTISFALPKLSYIAGVLNDPLGLGWHLLGSSGAARSLDVSGFSPILEVVLVLVGTIWSTRTTQQITRPTKKPLSNIPVLAFYVLYSAALLWLLVG